MNVPFLIARRYLVSKRKKNFINIISILSVVSVAFSTAALLVVLSVFNGLGDLLHSLNNAFDAELRISAKGKSFPVDSVFIHKIKSIEGVNDAVEVIEDYAYARFRDASQLVVVKGVSDNFMDHNPLSRYITAGDSSLKKGNTPRALIGTGLKYYLSTGVGNDVFPLSLYYIKDVPSATNISNAYTQMPIIVGGSFQVMASYDDNYVIAPLQFVDDLFSFGQNRTAIELRLNPGANVESVQSRVQNILGAEFEVLDRDQQHRDIYKLLRMEKLFTFLAFIILLLIGSVSIFFSLMMLALDKQKDISVLGAVGATPALIRKIFLAEGMLIAIIGAITGVIFGVTICLLQQQYGLISMGMASSVVQGYPVKIVFQDVILTTTVVLTVTFFISFRPAVLASRSFSIRHL